MRSYYDKYKNGELSPEETAHMTALLAWGEEQDKKRRRNPKYIIKTFLSFLFGRIMFPLAMLTACLSMAHRLFFL